MSVVLILRDLLEYTNEQIVMFIGIIRKRRDYRRERRGHRNAVNLMKKFPAKFALVESEKMELTYAKSQCCALTMTGTRFKQHVFVPTFTYIQREKQTGNYLRRTRRGIRICFARIHSLRTLK